MNLNLIDLLKQKVSATVLEGETAYLSEKSQALSNFIPILLSIFKSKPEFITNLQQQLNPRLGDIFIINPSLKQEFLQQISGTVPTEIIESTLNRSIAPTLGVLEDEAGSSDSSAITHLIENHWPAVSSALPHWAPALLSALGMNTALGQTLHQAPPIDPDRVPEEKRKSADGARISRAAKQGAGPGGQDRRAFQRARSAEAGTGEPARFFLKGRPEHTRGRPPRQVGQSALFCGRTRQGQGLMQVLWGNHFSWRYYVSVVQKQ